MFLSYATYTFDQELQPSFTAHSNSEKNYARGFSYPAGCGMTGHQSWPSSRGEPWACTDVIVRRWFLRDRNYFYLIRSSVLIFFRLHCAQEVTTFFIGKVAIVLVFIVHTILHGCWYSVPSCNTNIIIREFFVTNGTILLIILIPLLRSWGQKLS